jgi:hypothetical protein
MTPERRYILWIINQRIRNQSLLHQQIIDGTLDDPKLETTLFPNGKPSK